jgi:tetratricopeptide (TPR) repeat protein
MTPIRPLLALLCLLPLIPSCSLSQEELDRISEYRQRAAQYYDVNDLARAEQQARTGLEIDPENGDLQHLLGRTLLKKGDHRSVQLSRQHLEIAHEETGDFKTAYSLGEYHLRHAELLIGSAIILRTKLDKVEATETTRRTEMDADIIDRETRSVEHLHQALELLDQALAERSEWVEALQHRASTLAHLQQNEEALLAIEELCAVLQRSRENKYSRLSTQQFDLAQETYWRDSLLKDIAWEVEARGLSASILMNDKQWAEAEGQLTEILKLTPNRANEFYNRGLARYFQGSLQGAANDMRSFLGKTSLTQDSQQVERAMAVLEEFGG